MNKQCTESIQNRFSAYLMAAVSNRRIKYLQKKSMISEREYVCTDCMENRYTEFGMEYGRYINDQIITAGEDMDRLQQILFLTQEKELYRAISDLKERDRALLFGRVFGELNFKELGNRFGMTEKQAEMAYYYVIRKVRKRLEGKRDEF